MRDEGVDADRGGRAGTLERGLRMLQFFADAGEATAADAAKKAQPQIQALLDKAAKM